MTELTDEAVKALLDGATPGWELLTRRDGSMLILTRNAIGSPNRHIAEMSWGVYEPGNGEGDAQLASAAPDLARALLDARAERDRLRADAQAAVALVVEQAAEEVDRHYAAGDMGNPGHWVRALAPADGLAAVDALRAERDAAIRRRDSWRDDYKALSAAIVGDTGLSAMTVATQARLFRLRAEAAEAHVAALTARVEGLTGAITFALSEYDAPNDIDEAMSKLRTELSKAAALAEVQADARREGGE